MKISWYLILSFLQREFRFSTTEWTLVFLLLLTGMLFIFGMKTRGRYDTDRMVRLGTLSFYMAMVAGVTLLNRDPMPYHQWNFSLFWSHDAVREGSAGSLLQIVGNIVMFLPWGFLIPYIWKEMRSFSCVLLASLGFTLMIECVQFITKRGLFELDDIVHNTIGGILGYGIFMIWIKWKDRKEIGESYVS